MGYNEELNNSIAQDIEYNIAQEAYARKYYYELLKKFELIGDDFAAKKIKEIIDDELNHSIILMKLAQRQTNNKPSEFQSIMSLKKKGSGHNE